MSGAVLLIPLAIIIAIAIRLAAGGWDRDRIRSNIESHGGKLLNTKWDPFGPGWFGEKSDRIYQVRYVDSDGAEHVAHCKTSLTTGVYFTEDRALEAGGDPAVSERDIRSLEAENRELREELDRLRQEKNRD
jgi:hypothetical protein